MPAASHTKNHLPPCAFLISIIVMLFHGFTPDTGYIITHRQNRITCMGNINYMNCLRSVMSIHCPATVFMAEAAKHYGKWYNDQRNAHPTTMAVTYGYSGPNWPLPFRGKLPPGSVFATMAFLRRLTDQICLFQISCCRVLSLNRARRLVHHSGRITRESPTRSWNR